MTIHEVIADDQVGTVRRAKRFRSLMTFIFFGIS